MTTITARERLINAAIEAFAEKGFAGTTTRDIASRAGMSPAAVYVHHDSKESLLFTVSLDGHRSALDVITAAAGSSTDPIERLRSMVYDFSLWHADNSRVGRIVQYEYHALSRRAPRRGRDLSAQHREDHAGRPGRRCRPGRPGCR